MIRYLLVLGLLLIPRGPLLAQSSTTNTAGQRTDAEREALLLSLQAFVDSLSAPPGYVREVYRYPRIGRLDPVEPPLSIATSAAFPELRLTGILFDDKDPLASAVILRVTRGGLTTRYVVRVGDEIAERYRVVAVEPNRVVIEVPVYGGVRLHTLERNPTRRH